MERKTLSPLWDYLTWQDFQVLVLHFAETHLPDVQLDEFLKQGNKQYGIDLIQRNPANERGITIQCKREKRLTEAGLEALIQEFLNNDYLRFTSTFYLATSADLKKAKLETWLQNRKRTLRETHDVDFIWWDIHYLEQHLKNMTSLVAKHFGKQAAEEFCYEELRIVPLTQLKPVKNAIPRKIEPIDVLSQDETAIWYIQGANAIDLAAKFTEDRMNTNRICLIAEPYQGKTTLLKQCAYDLGHAGLRIQPIYIDVKKEIVQHVENWLNDKYGAWKTIPLKDIVLFFDGLDEAPSSRFLELVRHIRTFSETYHNVSIVVACRNMFYHRYSLNKELPNFNLYQLSALDSNDIINYAKNMLGERQTSSFQREVRLKQFETWLFHPFYLVNLIDRFRQKKNLPDSKQQVVDDFIQKCMEKAGKRLLNNGERLSSQSNRFRAVAERLAICMQLTGKNSLSATEFQHYFDKDDTELLQHSFLVSYHRQTWTFTNAFLQEYLAASFLCHKKFAEIKDLVSVGRKIRKIRTKWIETLHSLLSLLSSESNLFRELLQFIEEDSLELIFRTDPSLHTGEFRLNALKKLLVQTKNTGVWPQTIPTQAISALVNNVPGAIDHLVSCLKDSASPEHLKRLSARILADMEADEEEAADISDLVRNQLTITGNPEYAGELVAILAAWGAGSEHDIRTIINIRRHNGSHRFRNSVYSWITALALNDKFWGYGIEGVPILIAHNRPISQTGSEYELERFFLTVRYRWQLYALFKVMATDEWHQFYQFKESRNDGFVNKLMQKCVQLSADDPFIFLPISQLILTYGLRHPGEDTLMMLFVKATQTHSLIVRTLGTRMFGDKAWSYGPLLTKDSIDHLIWLFEEQSEKNNIYEHRLLMNPPRGLWNKASEIDNAYREAARAATEGHVYSLADTSNYDLVRKAEELRLKNDLSAVQNIDLFRKAVEDFFSVARRTTVKTEDLLLDPESPIGQAYSPLISAFLREWVAPNKNEIKLKDCLAYLEDEENFEFFRATEILEYSVATDETKKVFDPITQQYYYKNLPNCDFENSYELRDDTYKIKPTEILIGRIYEKYRFPTHEKYLFEFIWLDQGVFSEETLVPTQKTGTLSSKILADLGDNAQHLLADAVLSHLRIGIYFEPVLTTHLQLCGLLRIKAAQTPILQIIRQREFDRYRMHHVIDVYIKIGGKMANLLPLLETLPYNDILFEFLLRKLADAYPDRTAEIAASALTSGQLAEEDSLKIARFLTKMGRPEGFRYQIDLLPKPRQSTLRFQNGRDLQKLDTAIALDMLKSLLYLTVTPDSNHHHPSTNRKYVIYEWLDGLAGKGEADLLQVTSFLEDGATELKQKYSDTTNLKWYQIRLLEKFRSIQEQPWTITDIREFLKAAN